MGITIEKISDNEHFEYKGDVTVTGSIGKNATVIIKEGSLIVNGDVGSNSEISLPQENTSMVVSSSSFFMGSVSIGGVSSDKSLTVGGNIENGVTVSTKAADFNIGGSIGDNCKLTTQSGDIKAGNIGSSSTLKTMSGDVKVGNVASNCSLQTMSGDVKAGVIGSNSVLKTMSGDVKVQSADESASLETMSGDIYENGVRRKKDKSHGGASISIGGMSFIGGVNGRVVVNGKDITSLIHSADESKQEDAEAPIRFNKFG